MNRKWTVAVCINAVLGGLIAFCFFLAPAFILIRDLGDSGLKDGGIPALAYRLHRSVSKKYEAWARRRVISGRALGLDSQSVSGTEWPIYSSVFYLWATEALQDEWNRNHAVAAVAPAVEARGAIEAAAALISDPRQARWVREYWGDDYLKSENLFYRMLLINGLASYQKMTGDRKYQELLSSQAETLATELDRSPFGLLDDYPRQCYPVDVLPAISAIRHADGVLGTDHSTFAARALRGFQGRVLDPETGLPAYLVDSRTGEAMGPARGVGISSMLDWASELWPDVASQWYANYEKYFWREGRGMAGFREYRAGSHMQEWFMDVDAGPVISGYGTTASGFGIGASRVHGRLDHAYAMSAEAMVVAWPLPDGTLLGARMLSSASDAPYVGEMVLLFNFTRRPANAANIVKGGGLPPMSACLGIAFFAIAGILMTLGIVRKLMRWFSSKAHQAPPGDFQFLLWIVLLAAAVPAAILLVPIAGLLCLLAAQLFPLSTQSRRQTLQNP